MEFKPVKKVNYTVYASDFSTRKNIPKLLNKHSMLSFDVETRSLYEKEERQEAKKYLKDAEKSDLLYKQARVVSESSGLSYPSLTRTTHFIFGESRDTSHIVICNSVDTEMLLWNMIAEYQGMLLVHNSLFDLKIMYQRIKKLPKDYLDTALMVKCIINHVNIWKAKTSLKDLMGEFYDPKWSLMKEYEPVNFKEEAFLNYCAIDGASTFYLYEIIQYEMAELAKSKIA